MILDKHHIKLAVGKMTPVLASILSQIVPWGVRILALFALYILFVPKVALGNLFFGNVQVLYNLPLAKFFYKQSIHYDEDCGLPIPFAHYQLARASFIEGNLEKSLSELTLELTYYPLHYHAHYMQGLVFGYMERYKEAIDAFGKYIEANPKTWAGRNDRAWLQFRIGDIDGALATIEPAYASFPDNPWVLNTYGTLLMNKGNLRKAKEVLQKGLAVTEKMPEASWGRAYPGNDPRVYPVGLSAMKNAFKNNLTLISQKEQSTNPSSSSVDKKR
jgi:tetratricopeptide (TPR) repeat protein